ncbi:MAG: virulence protein RhuM/Fic/DOC family protein [Rickettsiaceae bacterium]|nr:virulence protein RhuM/Fic/DOC family protein [Rickettsiaceae bacterium]
MVDLGGDISIFQNEDGSISVNVLMREKTLWLSAGQMAELFGRDKSVISRHLKNIFEEGELEENSAVAFFATTASDGKSYQVEYFNLDAIISVGYRVNSKQGTKFRKWATNLLNRHLLDGYTINNDLSKEKLASIKEIINVMECALAKNQIIDSYGLTALKIISLYTKTWSALLKYDENTLEPKISGLKQALATLPYHEAIEAISKMQSELMSKNEATNLFGKLREIDQLKGIIESLDQGFGNEYIYPTNISRAAHLLYFIIKDHPFIDGNKRIGCLLFMLFLEKSHIDLKIIDTNSLTLMALLVAESQPAQKEIMIKLIEYIICS